MNKTRAHAAQKMERKKYSQTLTQTVRCTECSRNTSVQNVETHTVAVAGRSVDRSTDSIVSCLSWIFDIPYLQWKKNSHLRIRGWYILVPNQVRNLVYATRATIKLYICAIHRNRLIHTCKLPKKKYQELIRCEWFDNYLFWAMKCSPKFLKLCLPVLLPEYNRLAY